MSSFDFGAEFPHNVEARENLLHTLDKLGLYKPEICWEDVIMEAYQKIMKNHAHYTPSTITVSPNTLEALKKYTK